MNLPIRVEIKQNKKFKVGQRVSIIKLDGKFLGDLVHGYIQKYVGMEAEVVEYLDWAKYKNVVVQPFGYKGTLRVNENEISEQSQMFVKLRCQTCPYSGVK